MQSPSHQDAVRPPDAGVRTAAAAVEPDLKAKLGAVNSKVLHTPCISSAAASGCEQLEEDVGSEQQQADGQEEGDWQKLLWDVLSAAVPPIQFACSGKLSEAPPAPLSTFPDITVEGFGPLALPLSKEQAAALKAVAEQAPHGRGLRTVVDTAVRDAYQVDASKISIASGWDHLMWQLESEVSTALGLSDYHDDPHHTTISNIEARLYKLLLYEQGGHFSAHQDTEKERGMVGTLVVQLPCEQGHSGGTLTVRHKGGTHTHNFAEGSDSNLQYAAFFADCEHELSPITTGLRLVLVYNLVWVGEGPMRTLRAGSEVQAQLKRACKAWEAELAGPPVRGGKQTHIAFLLEHEYTEANLRFEHLKGRDRHMVGALSSSRDFEVHLALVQRTVLTNIEEDSDPYRENKPCRYGYRYDYDSEDEDEENEDEEERNEDADSRAAEVLEDGIEAAWVNREGTSVDFDSCIDVEAAFWDPDGKELFGDDEDPDDEEENYTGNEGATREQIYRRTLLVVWPRSQALAHAAQAGFDALQALLSRRVQDSTALEKIKARSSARKQQQQQQAATAADTAALVDTGDQQQQQQQGAADAAVEDDTTDQQQQHQRPPKRQRTGASTSTVKVHADTSHMQKTVHQELFQVLRACVKHLEMQLRQSSASSYTQQVTAVLQRGVKAIAMRVKGAAVAVQRLLLAVATSPGHALRDGALVAAMSAAAGWVDAAVVGPPLQQMVSICMSQQSSSCIAFIRELASQPQLQQQLATAALGAMRAEGAMASQLLALALAVPGLAEQQQQIVAAVAAGVQADTSAHTADCVSRQLSKFDSLPQLQHQLRAAVAAAVMAAGPVGHVTSCAAVLQAYGKDQQLQEQFVQGIAAALNSSSSSSWQAEAAVHLLPLLQDSLPLQKSLRAAIAGSIFTNRTLLAAQTDSSLLQLSGMLLGDKQLRAAYYDHFAAAVLQHRADSCSLLKQLLQSAEVQAALDVPEVQQLVVFQVHNLERLSAVPAFSWNMPQAAFPSNKQVEDFLRGPLATLTLSGFKSIKEARKTAEALLPPPPKPAYSYGLYGNSNRPTFSTPTSNTSETYSFTVVAAGAGQGAHVVLSKTRDWYNSQVRVKEAYAQELKAVRKLQQRSSAPVHDVIVID